MSPADIPVVWDMVWNATITFVALIISLILGAYTLLEYLRLPPWLVVIFCTLAGALLL